MAHRSDARSDSELVAAVNRRDADAFEVLYRRHRDWVLRLAFRFCPHGDDAQDVLQETFAYLLRRVPRLALTARMTTFLYPVVKNLSIAARGKRLRFVSDDPEPFEGLAADPGPAHGDARTELTEALSALSDRHREVVLLRFVDDFSLEEIAAALEIPLGTVKSRLHHAIRNLEQDGRLRQYFET